MLPGRWLAVIAVLTLIPYVLAVAVHGIPSGEPAGWLGLAAYYTGFFALTCGLGLLVNWAMKWREFERTSLRQAALGMIRAVNPFAFITGVFFWWMVYDRLISLFWARSILPAMSAYLGGILPVIVLLYLFAILLSWLKSRPLPCLALCCLIAVFISIMWTAAMAGDWPTIADIKPELLWIHQTGSPFFALMTYFLLRTSRQRWAFMALLILAFPPSHLAYLTMFPPYW
jgi:hypothetical protein